MHFNEELGRVQIESNKTGLLHTKFLSKFISIELLKMRPRPENQKQFTLRNKHNKWQSLILILDLSFHS